LHWGKATIGGNRVLEICARLPELSLSATACRQAHEPTCRYTKKGNEGDANPFRGDIVVLELWLVGVGAVRAFGLF
jgi:hypothetical protein